jgi:outer membrane receptor for ferrienterochelin and colicins
MYLRRTIYLLASLLLAPLLHAQDLHGTVSGRARDGSLTTVPDARVLWLGGATVLSDLDGRFTLPPPPQWPAALVIGAVGFPADTLTLDAFPSTPLAIVLDGSVQLGEARVVERQQTTVLSTRSLQAIEALGAKELKRAACCDLSESFETNATVDVSFSDAISGTKTIRMLGLDGKYAQLSVENIPFIRGLSGNYGMTLIPGPWIGSINVSKGIGTAVNGPNAMTGQIDLCLLDPLTAPPLFTNLYVNSQGRTELNVNAAQRTGKNSANLIMMQGNLFQGAMDQNNDGFLDQPYTKRFNIMDRWMQSTDKRTTQVILRYVTDIREGGQMHSPLSEHEEHDRYAVDIDNEMLDVIVKNGWILGTDGRESVGMMVAGRQHFVTSLFGERLYDGRQHSLYANVIYQRLLGAKGDQIKAGGSFQFDDYKELFRQENLRLDLGRVERMPGIFAEYTRSRGNLTLVAGVRGDLNSAFGNVVSPRLHVKYDLGPLTTIRLSSGHAFRTANPLVENASALASARELVIEGPLGMERAWNNGISFLHKFKWLERKWTFGVDAYRSDFTDQVVTDLDRSPQVLAIYMLDGASYGNSVLGDITVGLTRQLDLKLSYRWYDVRTTFDGTLRERPFIPTHRGLVDMGYESRNEHWRFDASWNIFGTSRLPDTDINPTGFRMPDRAPMYSTLSAQATYVTGPWDFYLGGENLTNTLQSRQILSPTEHFGPYFDASLIWGPTNKAMGYAGLRFTLDRRTTTETP